MKAGLLCNPLSGRIRRRRAAWINDFAASNGFSCREASTAEAIGTALASLLAEDIEVLAVAGGDGTVQAVLTHLFTQYGEGGWPLLTIIPAGTTNMTAMDLGVRGGPERVLGRLVRNRGKPPPSRQVTRPVLRVERRQQPDLYGMFFGAGAIVGGVRYFHERVRRTGLTGEWASGLVVLRALAGLPFPRHRGVLQAARATVIGNGIRREGSHLIILASALDRLLLGMRPYWGREAAPVHVTLVGESPPRLWRSLIPLLCGHGARLTGQPGYDSYNTALLELFMNEDFIIDGELHRASGGDSVMRITSVGPVSFFVP